MKIKILIPIYNDWESVLKLIANIDLQCNDLNSEISVLIINDASTEKKPEINLSLNNLNSVQIINMKKNKGHSRCNAAALKYINEKEEFDYAIPMDGDGEDRPEEIKLLIEKSQKHSDIVITANRIKRSEGIIFKISYIIHKFLTFIFTGQSIKFGNFTCLPKSIVNKMVNEAATWSSFSGALSKVAKERKSIPSIRGYRYFGPSKMSFIKLLKHSLSIIAVFKFNLFFRSLIFLATYIFLIIKNISVITFMPVVLIILMNIVAFSLSNRENITELNNSLDNIGSVEVIK